MVSDQKVRKISLLLQKLDLWDDRPADHPKYYDEIAEAILAELEESDG